MSWNLVSLPLDFPSRSCSVPHKACLYLNIIMIIIMSFYFNSKLLPLITRRAVLLVIGQEEGLVSDRRVWQQQKNETRPPHPHPDPHFFPKPLTQEQHELLPFWKSKTKKQREKFAWGPIDSTSKKLHAFFYWMLSGSLVLFIHVLVSCQF